LLGVGNGGVQNVPNRDGDGCNRAGRLVDPGILARRTRAAVEKYL
jgi:hypothetical protein